MLKRLITDPSLLILLLGNAWCIYYFNAHPEDFNTIIWIYWCQSVIIGLFNFLDMLTLPRPQLSKASAHEPINKESNGCVAFFFLVHYGLFHLAYLVFIAVQNHQNINLQWISLGAIAFFLESVISFRNKKIAQKTISVNVGVLVFLPYLRIIPMHLTILLPEFMEWHPSMLFLVLKSVADLLFYLITWSIYYKRIPAQ